MSLQNLVLPDLSIAELYKDIYLINEREAYEGQEAFSASDADKLKFLGNNLKNIAIIVRHSNEVFLPERHLEFLTKMLGACKLNIGDVAIVNEGNWAVSINMLKEELQPKQIILFGIEPTEIKLPLSFPQFKIQEYARCSYLYVPSLEALNNETEEGKLLKTRLWVCLKALFDVNGAK